MTTSEVRRTTIAGRIARHCVVIALALLGVAARAQPAIGLLQFEAAPDTPAVKLFLQQLGEQGFAEGRNLRVERRYADGLKERFAALIHDLAQKRVNAIVAFGHDMAKVAKEVEPAMPVIAFGSEDPVRSGLVSSLSRPGGKVTGVTFMTGEVAEKRLELLKTTIPGLARVAVVWEPEHVDTYWENMEKAAGGMGISLNLIRLHSAADLDGLAESVKRTGAQAVFIVPSRITQANAARLAQQFVAARLPTMAAYHSFVEAGGLLSYGADIPELFGRMAVQTRRVLTGTSPGDLPVELPNRLLLVVNRTTARNLGIALPQSILLRADRVIE
jgi:putative ABC transport system substrate-binding protein